MRRALVLVLLLAGCFIEPDRPGGPAIGGMSHLTVGGKHACVIDADQRIRCWGANATGEIDSSMLDRPSPVVVSSDTGWTDIAAGLSHTCGIRDGTVYCWGDGAATAAVDLPSQLPAVSIFAGGRASCAIDTAGTTYCWGAIDGTAPPFAEPQEIHPSGDMQPYMQIAITGDHACARTDTNGVYCWGQDNTHQITGTTPQPIQSAIPYPVPMDWIAVGSDASCGVTADTHALVCWGSAASGQLGDQTMNSDMIVIDDQKQWSRVALAHDHVCAVTTAGEVGCFGDNQLGALGDGFGSHRALAFIDHTTLGVIESLGVGDDHTCAVDKGGFVSCWGSNTDGELGNREIATSLTPVTVPIDGAATAVFTGGGFSCALVGTKLSCWGDNRHGQASATSNSVPFLAAPTSATDLSVDLVTTGDVHTCVVPTTDAANVTCWGDNSWFQLDPRASDSTKLATVDATAFSTTATAWREIAGGSTTTCGRTDQNTVECWGTLTTGASGIEIAPPGTSYPGPIANGNQFSLFLADVGTTVGGLQAAAGNQADPCEHSLGGSESMPKTLNASSSNTDWQLAVAGGGTGAHLCVHSIASGGAATIGCAGNNTYHQAGSGGQACLSVLTPMPPPAATPWADASHTGNVLAVSSRHSCALGKDEKIYCWGQNYAGELGSLTSDQATPQAIFPDRFTSIAAGPYHTCAITPDGQVQCWGWNRYGEVGNGFRFHEAPVQVQF